MPLIGALTTFSAGTKAKAAEVNSNFTIIRNAVNNFAVFKDVAATISATITFSAAPVLAVGASIVTGGLAIAAGGITVVGNSSITGTLGGITGLTVASGGAVISGGNLRVASGQGSSAQFDVGNSGAGTAVVDWDRGNSQKITLTGNATLQFGNPLAGAHYFLRISQDATGSRTVTWPAAVHWSNGVAPTLTTTASRVDLVAFYYDGTTYFGVLVAANFVA